MAEVGSAFVSVLPSARGFGTSLNRQVGPQINRSGALMGAGLGKSLLKGFLVIGVVTKIAGFVSDAFAEGREAQKVGKLTDAVLKSTGGVANVTAGQVADLSDALSLKIGVDDEVIQSAANMLLTFTKIRDEVGKGNDIFTRATTVAQDMAATFKTDATSAAKQLGKALNDPVKGVTALSRMGVQFTEQQKAQIETMVESGNVLGAQKLILAELGTQTRGAAAATATFGDKSRVAFDNIKEQIGTALIPALDSLGKVFVEKIAPAISGFITNLQSGKGEAGAFGNFVREKVVPALRELQTYIFTKVVPAIRDALVPVLEKGREVFDKIRKAVKDNEPELRQLFSAFKKVADFVLTKLIPAQMQMARVTLPILGGAIRVVINLAAFWVSAFNAARAVVNKASGAISTAAGEMKFAAVKILVAFKGLPAKLQTIGVNIVLGLVRGIGNAAGLVDAAVRALVDRIPAKIRGMMGISSPSKVTQELGEFIGEGLAKGIGSKNKQIADALQKVIDGLRSKLSTFRDEFASLSESVSSAFTSNLFESETAGGFISNLLDTKGQLTQLKAAFTKLIGYGLKPAFLSQLFASGNGGLILDLAAGSKAQAAQAGSLFGQVGSLSTQLGNQVARADIGPKIDKTNQTLEDIADLLKKLPPGIGKEINGAARSGRRRAA